MENYYNNQPIQPQMQPQQPQKPKRGCLGCLTFILGFFLVIALIIGGLFALNKMTKNQMEEFMPDHPYVLDEADTRYSIKNDFVLPSYIKHEGKNKDITWKANSDVVTLNETDEIVEVTVHETEKPKKVILTATYKMFIFKATRTYEVQILPTDTIVEEDVYIVDIDAVDFKLFIYGHINSRIVNCNSIVTHVENVCCDFIGNNFSLDEFYVWLKA